MLLKSQVGYRAMLALSMALLTVFAVASSVFATDETPANLSEQDTGNILPVSLFKGRVSNQSSRYILGPGDKISIKIKDLDKFNQSLSIRPDGYASIQPYGEIYIAGTDVQGLQSWLEKELKTYLLKPEVTVDVDEMRPALVYVKGSVQHPGTYQFVRQKLETTPSAQERVEMTLSNVLGKAGGLGLNADIDHIEVLHASTGQKETFSLRELMTNAESVRDIWLLPEDSVMVPALPQPMDPETFKLVSNSTFFRDKFPVVVLGAVSHQGEVQIDPTNNTLDAAIALAGGYVGGLSKRDAVIMQRPNNKGGFSRWVVQTRKSNLDLMPGDVVYIPDSKVAWMERGFRFLGTVVQPYYFGVSGSSVLKTTFLLNGSNQ
jgi:polysaccharide export outer membrane protein